MTVGACFSFTTAISGFRTGTFISGFLIFKRILGAGIGLFFFLGAGIGLVFFSVGISIFIGGHKKIKKTKEPKKLKTDIKMGFMPITEMEFRKKLIGSGIKYYSKLPKKELKERLGFCSTHKPQRSIEICHDDGFSQIFRSMTKAAHDCGISIHPH